MMVGLLSFLMLCMGCSAYHMPRPRHNQLSEKQLPGPRNSPPHRSSRLYTQSHVSSSQSLHFHNVAPRSMILVPGYPSSIYPSHSHPSLIPSLEPSHTRTVEKDPTSSLLAMADKHWDKTIAVPGTNIIVSKGNVQDQELKSYIQETKENHDKSFKKGINEQSTRQKPLSVIRSSAAIMTSDNDVHHKAVLKTYPYIYGKAQYIETWSTHFPESNNHQQPRAISPETHNLPSQIQVHANPKMVGSERDLFYGYLLRRPERSEEQEAKFLEEGESNEDGKDQLEVESNKDWQEVEDLSNKDGAEVEHLYARWKEETEEEESGSSLEIDDTRLSNDRDLLLDHYIGDKRRNMPGRSDNTTRSGGVINDHRSKPYNIQNNTKYSKFPHCRFAYILYSLATLTADKYIHKQERLKKKLDRNVNSHALKQMVSEEHTQTHTIGKDNEDENGVGMKMMHGGVNIFNVSGWQGYIAISVLVLVMLVLTSLLAISGAHLYKTRSNSRCIKEATGEKLPKSPLSISTPQSDHQTSSSS